MNSTALKGTKIGQILQMLRSYFYSSSIWGFRTPQGHDGSYFCSFPSYPQGLRLPRAITEAIFVLPKVPTHDGSYFCFFPKYPQGLRLPRAMTEAILFFPSTPRNVLGQNYPG